MDDGIRVNEDGLFDAPGLIDSLIEDCNAGVQSAMGGNYIGWCKYNVQTVQKLAALKKGVTEERDQLLEQIDDLQKRNDRLVSQLYQNNEAKEAGDHV